MTVHVAIIGYGTVSAAHIEALNAIPDVRVSAIYSAHLSGDEAAAVSEKHQAQVYSDLDALLANPAIQIVSICSRPDKHAEQAIAAAQAGKHIILEKPIALSWADCQRVQEAVAQAGVMADVCFECRYSDQLLTTKQAADNRIGEITYCEASYFHGIGPHIKQFNWSNTRAYGGSSLLSAGCHAVDAVRFILGDPVIESVHCISSKIRHPLYERYEFPPHQFVQLQFKNGQVGYVASSIACNQPYEFPVRVIGSDGSIKNDQICVYNGKPPQQSDWQPLPMKLLQSGDVADHPYRKQFEAFIERIQAGDHTATKQAFQSALTSHQVCFAANASAKRSCSIRLDELDRLERKQKPMQSRL